MVLNIHHSTDTKFSKSAHQGDLRALTSKYTFALGRDNRRLNAGNGTWERRAAAEQPRRETRGKRSISHLSEPRKERRLAGREACRCMPSKRADSREIALTGKPETLFCSDRRSSRNSDLADV